MTLDTVVDALRCPYCHGESLTDGSDSVCCDSCASMFPVRFDIINTLIRPTGGVLEELRAGMREADMPPDAPFDQYIFRHTPRIQLFAERKRQTDEQPREVGMPTGYYRMTEDNFLHAFRHLELTGSEKVLEVGANHDLPFLSAFAERGCQCFATNIFFFTDEQDEPITSGITRVVGDMNALPYRDKLFDIVIFSATLHHTPNLKETIAEVARVLKPGGIVLILTEPVHGLLKDLWNVVNARRFSNKGRDEEIHEGEYSIFQYRSCLSANGLDIVESFFSPFYDKQLRSGELAEVRFGPVARVISLLWSNAFFRRFFKKYGLLAGQVLLGLQLNGIARKVDLRPYVAVEDEC